MALITIFEDVIFSEENIREAEAIEMVSIDLGKKFGAQLKSLRDVKKELSEKAKLRNCNAIINFTYGQKSSWFSMDNIAFWGKGFIAKLPQDVYDKIIAEQVAKTK